ncbi:hypothetical protein [Phormidium sp. CCY1219]|uniref:hypothetical protein n=1 Tax=Phormidium sp. CCY1219 TaxID=2886104 RepID=UPI002D1F115C|nr:hypothetical protein [Phormidium sp. CCY1219]MEB3827782.1 hypothetical protein [Phormidium sp. CCY1219]
MATWILTIGDSDVQLTTDHNWIDLYEQVAENSPLKLCENLRPPRKKMKPPISIRFPPELWD